MNTTTTETISAGDTVSVGGHTGTVIAVQYNGARVRWSDGKVEFLSAIDLKACTVVR